MAIDLRLAHPIHPAFRGIHTRGSASLRRGIPPELVGRFAFGMINAASPAQVLESLTAASAGNMVVNIDLGPIIALPRPASTLSTTYTDRGGSLRTKAFAPRADNKLRILGTDAELRAQLEPFLAVIGDHVASVGTVFLVDEPYLNGVSRQELERAIRVVRAALLARGAGSVKLGVIFAAAMFDPVFARFIDREAGEYAAGIDSYFRRGRAAQDGGVQDGFDDAGFEAWVSAIQNFRLTTYDSAGNMFTGGGLPQGIDVVAFDFYLSTMLFDGLYANIPTWGYMRFDTRACASFGFRSMSDIRRDLSFFQDGPVVAEDGWRSRDRTLLDLLFDCRMDSTLDALVGIGLPVGVEIMLIGESSNNGLLEFDRTGTAEHGQPSLLVEQRVLDEVLRTQRLYCRTRDRLPIQQIMYFVYDEEYDATIQLAIGGAKRMPSVMRAVEDFAASPCLGDAGPP